MFCHWTNITVFLLVFSIPPLISICRIINPFLQFLPTLEKGQFLGSDLNLFPCFGVPACVGCVIFDKKGTQSPNFNSFTINKGFGHFPKKYFNDLGGFISGHVAFLFKFPNQFKFVQCFFPQSQCGLLKNNIYLLGQDISRLKGLIQG